jgi:hypothetical protein
MADAIRRAYWRDVWRRVVRPKSVLDWAESAALVLFPIGLIWFALGRDKAMEEVITTALYMTAAAVVAGVFLVLRLANAAADIHAESLGHITSIERQRDSALRPNTVAPPTQTNEEKADQQKKFLLEQLGAFYARASSLRQKATPTGELKKEECLEWYNDVLEFLTKHFDAFTVEQFKLPVGQLPFAPTGELPKNQRLRWQFLNERMIVLDQIAKRL